MPKKHCIRILSKIEAGKKILNLIKYSLYAINKHHIKQGHSTSGKNKKGCSSSPLFFNIVLEVVKVLFIDFIPRKSKHFN